MRHSVCADARVPQSAGCGHAVHPPWRLALGVVPRDGPFQHLWNSGARLSLRKRLQQVGVTAAKGATCQPRRVDVTNALTQNAKALFDARSLRRVAT
jgi:hypothetical protein